MFTLPKQVGRVFMQAWRAYGSPQAAAIRPFDEWRPLPTGYAYDPVTDTISNANGDVLQGLENYWFSDYFYIVPGNTEPGNRRMTETGYVLSGQTSCYILASDMEVVEKAWTIEIGGVWYHPIAVNKAPLGQGMTWAQVTLVRRV